MSALMGAVALGSMVAAAPVLADGGPGRRSIKDAPVVAPFSWTGFYGGLNVGAHRAEADSTVAPANDATLNGNLGLAWQVGAVPSRHSGEGTGVTGGLQAGYNFQMSSILFGIETDIQGSTVNAGSGYFTPPNFNPGAGIVDPRQGAMNVNVEWWGTVRARLGVLLSPTLLAYVTGGLAYGEVARTWGYQRNDIATNAVVHGAFGTSSDINTGWTAGAGMEWAITNRVSLGAEYLYFNLDGASFNSTGTLNNHFQCNGAAQNCVMRINSSDVENHVARLKVNYKF